MTEKQIKDREEGIQKQMENKLGLEDSFTFNCKGCGSCCRDREDILLSPHDIYRGSKHLNIKPFEFFEKYCETYIGQNSKLPIIRLRPKPTPYLLVFRDPKKRAASICPLLSGGLCSVHQSKPRCCALFPLGRFCNSKTKEIHYGVNDAKCGANGKSTTVREWLAAFNIPHNEEEYIIWSSFVTDMVILMKKLESWTEKTKRMIWDVFLNLAYFQYDMSKDFLPQLKTNLAKLRELFQVAEDLIDSKIPGSIGEMA